MRRILPLAAIAALVSAPAQAQNQDPYFVMGLADVIAAEQYCALRFDGASIERLIAERVPADDFSFTTTLKSLVFVAERQQQDLSDAAGAAHCAQIARLADTFDLLQ